MTSREALLRNIPLFPRLVAVSAILALGAVGIGGLGFWGMSDVNGNLREIYDVRLKSLSALYELQAAQKDVTLGERALADARVLANPAARTTEAERVESAAMVLEECIKIYDGQRKDPREERAWSELRGNVVDWDRNQQALYELIGKRIKARQSQGENRAFQADFEAQIALQEEKTAALWKQSSEGMDRLISMNISGVGALYNLSQKTATAMRRTQVVTAALILAMAVALSLIVARSISRPLQELTRITRAIVQTGNLDQSVEVEGRDELGVLARTFQEMVEKLRVIPAASREVNEAVNDLTELILDQTASVQQQASGLAQVTATMQELRQTSSIATGKADTVIAVAQKADEFSGAGREAAESSLRGLEEIRARTDQITSKISDLSERMLLVSGITDTVKDLADQSNMLALNASIEAVRAGEMGKGFGVVAHEIRSLADQSVDATNRIRLVLGEIQGAIRSTAAMADQGKKDMGKSMEQIRSSGESLTEINAVITETGQAARQIAASVSQQNVGIAQITGAIEGLNQAMERTSVGISRAKEAAAKLSSLSSRVAETLAPTASS